MLGRFLEISVHASEILESLEFYQRLGFQNVTVGETWPHPYAVVTDGRLFLGLHQRPQKAMTLSFVQPDLARHVARLKALGLEFESERLGSDVFNEATFRDPTGQHVTLLEARTFSPPSIDPGLMSTCGYFTELGLPVREFDEARSLWESIGFVAMDAESTPFPRMALTSDRLNLGLYRTRALRQPVLTFEDPDMPERLARLRERGLPLSDEMPDALDTRCNAVLQAPEGTRLLLMTSEH